MELGLIHLYYGYGKGKTSSAIGLAIRAVGHDKKVLFRSFLKDFTSGECVAINKFNISIDLSTSAPVSKFLNAMTEDERITTKKEQNQAFQISTKTAINENYDILILDELIDALDLGCVPLEDILQFLKTKPNSLEVIITGHSECKELIEIANYVTEFTCKKHPYECGITARNGIEK